MTAGASIEPYTAQKTFHQQLRCPVGSLSLHAGHCIDRRRGDSTKLDSTGPNMHGSKPQVMQEELCIEAFCMKVSIWDFMVWVV